MPEEPKFQLLGSYYIPGSALRTVRTKESGGLERNGLGGEVLPIYARR
jgi:hypothetical protein